MKYILNSIKFGTQSVNQKYDIWNCGSADSDSKAICEVWHLVQIKHVKYEQINEYIYEFMNIWIMKILWMLIMNSTCNWRS